MQLLNSVLPSPLSHFLGVHRQWTPICRNLLNEHITGRCGVWLRQNRAEWRLETGLALEVTGLFSCNFYFETIAGSLLQDEYKGLLLSADQCLTFCHICFLVFSLSLRVCVCVCV